MKKSLFFMMLLYVGIPRIYAQNPVIDNDESGSKSHVIKAPDSKDEQKKRIKNQVEELQKRKKDGFSHPAVNQVDEAGMPIGSWARPVPEFLKRKYVELIKNAKRTGGKLTAVYKVKGQNGEIKEVRELYDVYTTGELTPWTTTDVHEMWDKLPCNHKLKRFYMSDQLWHAYNPEGLGKQVDEQISRALQRIN